MKYADQFNRKSGFWKKIRELFAPADQEESASKPFVPEAIFRVVAPKGLAHVHTAPDPSQADLMRQLLLDAGFHTEFVPSAAGIMGRSGSPHVFVRDSEEEEARAFIREYLQGIPDESGPESPE